MKNELLLAAIIVLASALAGCATTRIRVETTDGARVEFSCSKNVSADSITVDPQTRKVEIKQLRTDAASVINAQGAIAADVSQAVVTAAGAALVP